PWYSKEDIRTGEEWEASIRAGLEQCPWFLVVLSPRSQTSRWVQREVSWAMEHRLGRIIPVLLEDVHKDKLDLGLHAIQHVDCRSGIACVRNRILEPLGLPGPPDGATPPLPPRPPVCFGREAELQRLVEILAPEGAVAVQATPVAGVGGIGKSTLVLTA